MFDTQLGNLIKKHGTRKGLKKFSDLMIESMLEMDGAEKIEWQAWAYDWDGWQATIHMAGTKDSQRKEVAFVAAEHADGPGVGEELYYWFFEDENGHSIKWEDVPDYQAWL